MRYVRQQPGRSWQPSRANFKHLVARAAHLALTNRALATAILSTWAEAKTFGRSRCYSPASLFSHEFGRIDGKRSPGWNGGRCNA